MTLRRCFVQFMHPGPEHGPDRDGAKAWNADAHRRKFLAAEGTYLENLKAGPESGVIVFWGEWEPESEVRRVPEPRERDAPRWLHEPYYLRPASYSRRGKPLQNTDPFVFGDHFLYTICRQFTRTRGEWRPSFLHDLAAGSVILFGSHRRGEFLLDTVFVVADSVLHRATDWRASLAEQVGGTYADVTLGPLHDEGSFGEPRLYFGATPEAPVAGMFSFVPCLPAEEGTHGFPRPPIRLDGLVTPTQMMGMKGKEERSLKELKEAWDSVVSQVLAQDLMLGFRLALPPMRGTGGESSRKEWQDAGGEVPRIRC